MRLMYNIILFAVFVNLAIWLVQIFGLIPAGVAAEYDPIGIKNMFTLDIFVKNFMWAGIGVAAGLAGLLLRQNTFALYALVIFAVASFVPIVSNFIYAVPNLINAIMVMYPAYNPFSDVTTGVFAGTNPWSLMLVGVGYFAGFFFLIDKVTGGQTA